MGEGLTPTLSPKSGDKGGAPSGTCPCGGGKATSGGVSRSRSSGRPYSAARSMYPTLSPKDGDKGGAPSNPTLSPKDGDKGGAPSQGAPTETGSAEWAMLAGHLSTHFRFCAAERTAFSRKSAR